MEWLILMWWPTGFALALAGWFFLTDQPSLRAKYNEPRHPLTYGTLLMCAICGFAGPAVGLVVFTWALCWLGDKMNLHKILGRPVFPRRDR